MAIRPQSQELIQPAISLAYQRSIDAYTVEDAARYHSELVDLLAIEMMIVRLSRQTEPAKTAAIEDLRARASYHRDAVDRLTDIIENKQQLV